MQKLSKFEVVKQALEQIVSESDVNNGTRGVDFLCHFWQQESIFDKARQDVMTELARAVLAGNPDDIMKKQKELEQLPKSKIMMEFKLLQPIQLLRGTKVITDGEKTYKIAMENVTSIFIPEDVIKTDILEYEETPEMLRDAMGRDAQIIKLRLVKGIIDVTAPTVDVFGKILRPKRAMVTAMSYGAMQTAGRLLNQEKTAKRRRTGFDEQQ